MNGKFSIIGAGLKYDLITMRGLNHLREANIVLYDRLIDEKILKYTDAEKIDVGKLPYIHGLKQEKINDLIRSNLIKGKNVVRLIGGDSTVFSRTIEEIEIANETGSKVEIIPGVTSASTAASKIGCALTDRKLSSGMILITGHKARENLEKDYDWKAIVQLNITVVIYMGVMNMGFIVNNLMRSGLNAKTPAIIAEKLEMESERIFVITVDKISKVIDEKSITYPAIVIIGDVLSHINKKSNV